MPRKILFLLFVIVFLCCMTGTATASEDEGSAGNGSVEAAAFDQSYSDTTFEVDVSLPDFSADLGGFTAYESSPDPGLQWAADDDSAESSPQPGCATGLDPPLPSHDEPVQDNGIGDLTQPEPAFSADSQIVGESGENQLSEIEPILNTEPPPVEVNTDESGDLSDQNTGEEPALPGDDGQSQEFEDENETIFIFDPYFYYADGSRSIDYTTINEALDAFILEGGRGHIYVESGTFNESVFINNVANLTGIVFDRFDPKATGAPFNPYNSDNWPIINGNIQIEYMPSGFTLLGFRISGYVDISNCSGQLNLSYLEVSGSPDGINVTNHNGDVVISNVESNNNTNASNTARGARIHNPAGGNVTITNSSFNNNQLFGIRIDTNGVVNINGVSASGNTHGPGMILEVTGSPAPIPSSFSRLTINHAVFNSNNGRGLIAYSVKDAAVSISNFNAWGNSQSGIEIGTRGTVTVSDAKVLNNNWSGIYIKNDHSFAPRNVTLTRVNVSGNTAAPWSETGIDILSRGNVLLTDVSSSDNRNTGGTYHGLNIDNRGVETAPGVWNGAGSVTIRSSMAGASYDFSGNNRGSGIYIESNGVVNVSDVTANNNLWHGVRIENQGAPAPRNVTLTRVSVTGNTAAPWSQDGIYIRSRGNVLLTDVSSSDNRNTGSTYHGLNIDNRGVFNGGSWNGIGSVTVRSSRAGVTYNFSNNNRGSGIEIWSNGVVSVSDVRADNNSGCGIKIGNNFERVSNVTVVRSSSESNGQHGVDIASRGSITLTDVSANSNLQSGIQIYNTSPGSTGSVTVRTSSNTSFNSFSGNSWHGVFINSHGVVDVTNAVVSNNTHNGVRINNDSATGARNVTLTRVSVTGNTVAPWSNGGIYIMSRGNVLLTDVSSTDIKHTGGIDFDGLFIDNRAGTGSVTIRSSRAGTTYDFSGNNRGSGISILSNGAVSISDVRVQDNEQDGIRVENQTAGGARNVTLTRVSASGNKKNGVYIESRGNVMLTDVSSSGNAIVPGVHHGLYVDNTFGTGSVTVRSSRAGITQDFSDHHRGSGIRILSRGAVSISDVRVDYSRQRSNIWIENQTAAGARNVTLTRVSVTGIGNDSYPWAQGGIYIYSRGNVLLTDVSSSDSYHPTHTYHGLFIDNRGVQTLGVWNGTGSVTIRSSRTGTSYDFSGNNSDGIDARADGIHILSNGTVSISDVTADNNKTHGIRVENHTAGGARNVTLTRVSVTGNTAAPWSQDGIHILSRGNVLLTDVSSSDNRNTSIGTHGLFINNRGDGATWAGSGGVTIRSSRAGTTYDFSGNRQGNGIEILSSGVVSISDVNVSDNLSGILIEDGGTSSARNVALTRASGTGNSIGIYIYSRGNVLLTDVSSSNIGGGLIAHGLFIDNRAGTGSVTIRSSRAGTSFDLSGTESGIYILSRGTVSISDVRANNSQRGGIRIENQGAPAPRNVTLTRVSVTGNTGVTGSRDGIYIRSRGNVLLTDVSSSDNRNTGGTYHGLNIDNRGVQILGVWNGNGSVTIRSSRAGTYHEFSGNNRGSGIHILSNGVVSISNVTAKNNLWHGIRIENQNAPAPRNVTLTRVSVTGNTEAPWSRDGIYIRSRGNVLLTDVSSSDNRNTGGTYHGLDIDNRAGTGSVTIRSSRAGTYYDFSGNNRGLGILVLSNGTISISNVSASNNAGGGIQAITSTASRDIRLLNICTVNNDSYGIYARLVNGTVTVQNVRSHRNTGSYGIWIDGGVGRVNFVNSSFIGNGQSGILVRRTPDMVSLRNTYAAGNGAPRNVWILP